ncbi:MAG: hypothetical protein CR972_03085 [Candidatus Moraniibacteriota bacterium]|nr:MAG: hypothetical protein CR972_03085 [Candidatus Moranbacteria bacterium]
MHKLMKLFLTSNGLSNPTLKSEFIRFVEKSTEEISIAFIPTAANIEKGGKKWLIDHLNNIKDVAGYIDIVDISALPRKNWLPRLEKADVLFFGGGNSGYLLEWMKKSGLEKDLPKLLKTRIYAGISAGSMITNPTLYLSSRDYHLYYTDNMQNDQTLAYTNFYVRPHFDSTDFPYVNQENINAIKGKIPYPIYALDDDSAVVVDGEEVTVVSEGDKWRKFE